MEDIYGPEDIEKLLLSKDFSELLPEERTYVLRHIESESEYAAMRLMLVDLSSEEEELAPAMELRDELISLHESRYKSKGFKVWLNSLFTALTPSMEWRRPAMQFASVAGAILMVILVYRVMTPEFTSKELALEPETNKELPAVKEDIEKDQPVSQEERVEPAKKETPIVAEPKQDEKVKTPEVSTLDYASPSANGDMAGSADDLSLDQAPVAASEYANIEVISDDEEINMEDVPTETDMLNRADKFDADLEEIVVAEELEESELNEELESSATYDIAATSVTSPDLAGYGNSITKTSATVPSELISQLFTAW